MISSEIARILFGFITVIGLIGLTALAARKLGLASASGGLSRKRRLAIVETLAIDARRRAIIIKCDDKEHLVILGANGETIIDHDMEAIDNGNVTASDENPFAIFDPAQQQPSLTVKEVA